jgi:hypothetical protein
MGNNDLKNGENIYVKVEQQNLICIDPNSVEVDDEIQPRNVDHESLVMYVNLEADMVPRSTLTSQNGTNTLTSIARGNFNMMSTENGDLNTDWTESYLNKELSVDGVDLDGSNNDATGQSFGIESLSIITKGANTIPYVTINFVDVRGKTLFESPEKSPYKAFFHIPWPIFYLTVKGYYGKAIRYRLHLVNFTSRYNESNGNFDISTTFVGSTYAYLAEIPLKGMMNAPYMYIKTSDGVVTENPKTGLKEKRVSKSSKGYAVLKSVYTEMKQKNLIDENFPVKTLREIDVISKRLSSTLEKIILDEVVDPRVLNSLKEYGDNLNNFIRSVNSWGDIHLEENSVIEEDGVIYFLKKTNRLDLKDITGGDVSGTLEFIIKTQTAELNKSTATFNQITKERTNELKTVLTSPKLGGVSEYYKKFTDGYRVSLVKLRNELETMMRSFIEQDEKVLKEIEIKLNEAVKNPDIGFGFEPTLRNIFAVVLANAETYIRLLNDVHIDAFSVGEERKEEVQSLSDEYTNGESIYPWPEIIQTVDNKRTISYPGDPLLQPTLKSNDAALWPEVYFVEEYLNVSTNISDPLIEKEGGVNDLNIIFETDSDLANIGDINELFRINNILPYSKRNVVSFLYEFIERAKILTLHDSFNNDVLNELADTEFKTISEILKDENDIIKVLTEKINTKEDLKNLLPFYSNVRYPYYEDSLPTTDYITRLVEKPFIVAQIIEDKPINDVLYPKLKENLNGLYLPEEYRLKIYPFNSKKYLEYINKTKFDKDELKFYNGTLEVTQKGGFITSPFKGSDWLKKDFRNLSEEQNLFTQKLNYTNYQSTNILNTPYFHKQLYSDYNKNDTFGKYASSAYMLLNSLPYSDLDDQITSLKSDGTSTPPIRVSSLFREIGSTHSLPFHLVAKWGSIYHRYKKHKLDGVDILTGFTLNNNETTTTSIDYELFYNSGKTENSFTGYTVGDDEIIYTNNEDLGAHPYYDSIFHKIVNGEHTHDIETGNESFSGKTGNNTIRYKKIRVNNLNYWSGFVDNSKLDPKNDFYTLLPSDGDNTEINKNFNGTIIGSIVGVVLGLDTFENSQEKQFRVIWENEIVGSFENAEFFKPNEYNRSFDVDDRSYDKKYSLTENNTKIYDLLGTFSPLILEEFEEIFLDFATDFLNLEITNSRFPKIKYNNFQKLLKEIVTVNKNENEQEITDNNLTITSLKIRQKTKLLFLTEELCDKDNLLKVTVGNPKEIDPYVLEGFYGGNTSGFTYRPYNPSQLSNQVTQDLLDVYVGENPNTENNYYLEFFEINNVEFSDDYISTFRPLVLMYAGYRESGGLPLKSEFQSYVRESIFDRNTDGIKVGGANNRLEFYLDKMVSKFKSLKYEKSTQMINFNNGYKSNNLKVELYDYFKSFNDKWIAGNSINQRLLLEDFLFLDKANKDIGDSVFLNLDRFISIFDVKNENANLYSVISMLIQGTGLDMRPLPAYVNFYGSNLKNRTRVLSSRNVASTLFGTFLEVDYVDSSPKIIIQYVGRESKRLSDLDRNGVFKFSNDSFNISDTNKNPIIVSRNVFETEDLVKSNKVVAFEVNIGDQNNSMFKSVQLDQSTLKNTTESFIAMENMGRSETGSGAVNVDLSLFNIYRDRSYTCEITCMGNVMIQPTMYFYLKNIPMFRGTYWILEVSHKIQNNSIVTSFKGVRISNSSLPNPEDSFMSTYRPVIDKIINNIRQKLKNPIVSEVTTSKTIKVGDKQYTSNTGGQLFQGESEITSSPKAGVNGYGIPFNGYSGGEFIQKTKYNGEEWFRSKVVEMGSTDNPIEDNVVMSLSNGLGISTLTWGQLKSKEDVSLFYSVRMTPNYNTIQKILNGSTRFLNLNKDGPNNAIEIPHSYSFNGNDSPIIAQGPINNGPKVDGSGIALSARLMKELGIYPGDVILFRLIP